MKWLDEILTSENVVETIRKNSSLLFELIPELEKMVGFDHKHPHHHLDVWEHTLYALSLSPSRLDVRMALLFHDIGKPFSYTEGEVRHFHKHPEKSGEITEVVLRRLNYSDDFIKEICYLVSFHDEEIEKSEVKQNKSLLYKSFLVQQCDTLAHHPAKLSKRIKYLQKVRKYFFSLE